MTHHFEQEIALLARRAETRVRSCGLVSKWACDGRRSKVAGVYFMSKLLQQLSTG
jgi:hypothetical protein